MLTLDSLYRIDLLQQLKCTCFLVRTWHGSRAKCGIAGMPEGELKCKIKRRKNRRSDGEVSEGNCITSFSSRRLSVPTRKRDPSRSLFCATRQRACEWECATVSVSCVRQMVSDFAWGLWEKCMGRAEGSEFYSCTSQEYIGPEAYLILYTVTLGITLWCKHRATRIRVDFANDWLRNCVLAGLEKSYLPQGPRWAHRDVLYQYT